MSTQTRALRYHLGRRPYPRPPISFRNKSATTKRAAMGNKEEWEATEIDKSNANTIRRPVPNSSAKASKNADRNNTPAKTSGMICEVTHGRLVRAARTHTRSEEHT